MKLFLICLAALIVFVVIFPHDAGARGMIAFWEPNSESNLAGYRFYWSTNLSAVINRQVTPISLGVNQYCVCWDVDENATGVFYAAVSAFDTSGNESGLSNVGWYLFGNIAGDFNSGTSYNSGRVDGADLIILGLYFGQTVNHPTYNCNDCAQVLVTPHATDAQKCDLTKDGHIDGFDLIELGLRFGNASY